MTVATLELLTVPLVGDRFTITAKVGDDSLTDRVTVTSARSRTAFVKSVCARWPDVDPADVEQELEQLAHEYNQDCARQPNAGSDDELDVAMVVRPERFITPAVSGLTVATPKIVNGKVSGTWTLYLRWADGRRERCDLPESIGLSDDKRLWIHPTPGAPMAIRWAAWSAASRRAWLDGAPGPNPSELFRKICERTAHFVDLPEERAPGTVATLALWTLLTYAFPAWGAVPYLYLGGPVGSGKTRVLEVLERFVFRPLLSSNLTPACLFRTLHSQGGVLLLDEAERLRSGHPDVKELLSILLAGYVRGSRASRLEPVGDSYKPVMFDVYGPKAVACIAGLPPALHSRCIPVMMFRASLDSPKPRRRIDDDPRAWQVLRDGLHVLALEHGPLLLDLADRHDVCPEMSGRQFQLWQPLLALASWIESAGADNLTEIVINHARSVIEGQSEEQAPAADAVLLSVLAYEVRAGNAPSPGEVLAKAKEEDPEMFKRWYATSVTRRLMQYGLPGTTKRHGVRRFTDVTLDQLRRVQRNYGMDLGFLD